jgi:hypothetical protein
MDETENKPLCMLIGYAYRINHKASIFAPDLFRKIIEHVVSTLISKDYSDGALHCTGI